MLYENLGLNKFNLRIHKNLGVKMVDAEAASSGRAATAGKAPKAWALPGFSRLESGSSSSGMSLMWLPLWRLCLPKIGRGGPERPVHLENWHTFLIGHVVGVPASVRSGHLEG